MKEIKQRLEHLEKPKNGGVIVHPAGATQQEHDELYAKYPENLYTHVEIELVGRDGSQ